MRSIIGIGVLALAGVLATGCASGRGVSDNAIASHPSPEVQSIAHSKADIKFSMAYMRNQNGRMMWDDLGRFMFYDHPSRLSPYPILSLNGKPR